MIGAHLLGAGTAQLLDEAGQPSTQLGALLLGERDQPVGQAGDLVAGDQITDLRPEGHRETSAAARATPSRAAAEGAAWVTTPPRNRGGHGRAGQGPPAGGRRSETIAGRGGGRGVCVRPRR
ncbi:hypothetical protein [Streptosporangium vulgare]|uniref:hypothetical protein n=1 Tax=Streptosporangium vulgare TaxID=46190 RepID=UPI0031CF9956